MADERPMTEAEVRAELGRAMRYPNMDAAYYSDTVERLCREILRLREALEDQRRLWECLPCGIDEDADPNDQSPEDVFAWGAGLAVRAIREALGE